MFRKVFLLVCALGVFPASGYADAAEDAQFIAEQHLEHSGYAERLETIEAQTLASFQATAGQLGARILDPERFMTELAGAFHEEFLPSILEASTLAYIDILTPEELADLADLYRSEDGLKLLFDEPRTMAERRHHSDFRTGPGAPLYENFAQINARMQEAIQAGLTIIGASFTADRMADIYANPEIVAFDVEADRARIVAQLRPADD